MVREPDTDHSGSPGKHSRNTGSGREHDRHRTGKEPVDEACCIIINPGYPMDHIRIRDRDGYRVGERASLGFIHFQDCLFGECIATKTVDGIRGIDDNSVMMEDRDCFLDRVHIRIHVP